MRYLVRFREMEVLEVEVEAPTYREAFIEFQRQLEKKQLFPKPEHVRLFYEVESITVGRDHDSQLKRKGSAKHKTSECIEST